MKVGESVKMHGSECPNCHDHLDGAIAVGESGKMVPNSGDITICIKCGHISAYGDDLKLRNLTSEEMHAIAGDPRILAVQQARRKLDVSRKK